MGALAARTVSDLATGLSGAWLGGTGSPSGTLYLIGGKGKVPAESHETRKV